MKERRGHKYLIEPASSAIGDIVFILIIFFLICASVQPDSGRKQTIPKADEKKQEKQESKNIEVLLTRTTVAINGNLVPLRDFPAQIKERLKGKKRPEDRVVVMKSKPDTAYVHWIKISSIIEDAGGIITLQIQEEEVISVPN